MLYWKGTRNVLWVQYTIDCSILNGEMFGWCSLCSWEDLSEDPARMWVLSVLGNTKNGVLKLNSFRTAAAAAVAAAEESHHWLPFSASRISSHRLSVASYLRHIGRHVKVWCRPWVLLQNAECSCMPQLYMKSPSHRWRSVKIWRDARNGSHFLTLSIGRHAKFDARASTFWRRPACVKTPDAGRLVGCIGHRNCEVLHFDTLLHWFRRNPVRKEGTEDDTDGKRMKWWESGFLHRQGGVRIFDARASILSDTQRRAPRKWSSPFLVSRQNVDVRVICVKTLIAWNGLTNSPPSTSLTLWTPDCQCFVLLCFCSPF